MTDGPWRSVPTDGWTPELTERWVAIEEARLAMAEEMHEWRREDRVRESQTIERDLEERRLDHTAERELRAKRVETARLNAEAKLAHEKRMGAE